MDNLLKEKKGVGVIICRMQVPYLTESHKSVINTVLNRHPRIIIFLGTTNKWIDGKNPYPFEFRKQMIETTFSNPNITIVPLPDNANNAMWVKTLDGMIGAFLAYGEEAVLYGGRDSFIPYYQKDKGKHTCTELAPTDYDSGTELRTLEAIKLPQYTPESAQAILWTMRQLETYIALGDIILNKKQKQQHVTTKRTKKSSRE
jgi:hypothetical protein